MIVELRKTKITKSILEQSYTATENDLKTSEILGWCLLQKPKYSVRYILLYNSEKHVLIKYKFSEEINKSNNTQYTSREGRVSPATWSVVVRYGGGWTHISYSWKSEQEQVDFVENLKRVEKEAKEKGQIYI